jgi:PST family polysaccharide transporter
VRDGDLGRRWHALASIGVVVMMTNGLVILNDLSIRSVVTHRLGLGDLGFYVASSAIVWVNLSLVLNAMAADYYPRLSSVADDPKALSVTLNQQWHVGLLLAGPTLAAVSVAAPLALALLYAPSFAQSALVLRLLAAAGVLRLAIWALGFVLLARRATGFYMLAELVSALAIPSAWLALPETGLWGASAALLISSALSFVVYWRSVVKQGVWTYRSNVVLTSTLVLSLAALAGLFELNQLAGYVVGVAFTSILVWRSYGTIRAVLGR